MSTSSFERATRTALLWITGAAHTPYPMPLTRQPRLILYNAACIILIAFVFVWLFAQGIDRTIEAESAVGNDDLHKIVFTGNFVRLMHSHDDEHQPSDRELRYLLVHLTNYHHCQDFDYLDDTERCLTAIPQREIDLVRLAINRPERVRILIQEEEE